MAGDEFGPYRLVELLGSGGMGEVWRARDTRKDREIALKVLGAWVGADTEFIRRFRRESELASRLNAPNIVPVYDYGAIDGRLFLEMPLIAGTDLGRLVARTGPLPPGRAVEILAQVGRALGSAHRAGLVHRDVKPSNILVTDVDGVDHVYLIDFGIAHTVDSSRISVTGTAIGTPAYMAPERFAGDGDRRADIYALGCVLYEMLTGSPPFPGTNPLVLMNSHLNVPAPRVSSRRPDVPPALDDVVARAMAKEPDRRHGSAAELTADAYAALTGPVRPGPWTGTEGPPGPWVGPSPSVPPTYVPPAPPVPPGSPVPSVPPSGGRPRTRRRATWAAVAATAFLLVVGLVVGLVVVPLLRSGGTSTGDGSTSGVFADCVADPVNCAAVPPDRVRQGGQLTYALEQNITNWNVTSADGNTVEAGEVTKALLPYVWVSRPDARIALNTDLVTSADQVTPTTLVYAIKPGAAWDDGTPIGVDDFVFSWKTQNPTSCPDCVNAGNSGYDLITNITGTDGGRTVTVTLSKPVTDWKALFGSGAPLYPAHVAAAHGDLNTTQGLAAAFDWFGKNPPTYSGGPYKVASWQDDVALTLVPNPRWYGATKPKLDRLVLRVITDPAGEVTALQNDEVQAIYTQPQVDLAPQLRQIPDVSRNQGIGALWEHFDFNLRSPFLADRTLRQALFTAVDRQDLIARTVGRFKPDVRPLNSLVFLPQQQEYKDLYASNGQGSGDVARAKAMLAGAGYTGVGTALAAPGGKPVPTLRIRYTGSNAIRQTQCELFAQYAKQLGVTVTVQQTDDLGQTATSGDYDLLSFAWILTPFSYQNAQFNFLSTSGSNFGGYTNPRTDQLINQAATSANSAAPELLNQAGQILADDAYELPLYQRPTLLAVRNDVANVRNNATLDGPPYNISEWGLRAGS